MTSSAPDAAQRRDDFTGDHFRMVYDASGLGIARVGMDGHVRMGNPALESILGRSVEELRGLRFDEFTHPDDRARCITLFTELAEGARDGYRVQKRYLRPDGSVVHCRLVAARDPGDRDVVLATLEDITEAETRRQSEVRLLHDLGERMKELRGLHDMARLLNADHRPTAEVLDAAAAVLPPAFLVPEDTVARIVVGDGRHATAGWRDGLPTLSVAFETTDGRRCAVEAGRLGRVGTDGPTFLDEERSLLESLAGMLQAFLDRRQAEERLHMAVTAGRVSLWEWNVRTRRIRWPGRPGGDDAADPRDRGMDVDASLAMVHPEDRERLRSAIDRALANSSPGERFVAEYRVVLPGRGTRWILSVGEVFGDRQGVPDFILGVAADVTDRRSLEDRLRQAAKMEAIGRLAGGVAHDFNNLLVAILGYVQLASDDLPPDSPIRQHLVEVEKAGEMAAVLAKQLLAFARRQELRPRAINLGAIVEDTGGLLSRLLGSGVQIERRLDPTTPPALADPNQVRQVLLNLAVNARDAMPDGGAITLRVHTRRSAPTLDDGTPGQEADWIVLEVEDTGCGMPPEVRARIFEPFYTTKEEGKGTGLGLSTVYGVIHQSGGYLEVESEPGRGTLFRVHLPPAMVPERVA